jgi:tetratricopeptide (TPR) repeat protein
MNGLRGVLLPVVASILGLLVAAPEARADLASGTKKMLAGEYAAAKKDLAAVGGSDRGAAQLLLLELEARTGGHAAAEKIGRTLMKSRDAKVAADATVKVAEVLRATGRYARSEKLLAPLANRPSPHPRARWQHGLVLRDLGRIVDSKKAFEWFADQWRANKVDVKDSEFNFYMADSTRYLDEHEFANNTYRDVIDRAPKLLEANIHWGDLFLSKYAAADAVDSYDEVLKIDPHHPDAHAGMARAKLETSYDIATATRHLEQALKTNPRHIPALLIRAGIEIDQNKWDAAKKTIRTILGVNPHSFEALSLRATVQWLRDDKVGYEATRKKVLAANPAYAELYHIVARSAVREHRYAEAIELEKQAVAVNPEYYEAMQAIGTGYLRLGLEKEGVEWLKKAWDGDEYNLRTHNTLELYEEHIPRSYSFVKTKSFKIRYHNEEKELLGRYVEPLVEDAFADMVKRYKFKPKTPVVLELYQNPDHYSVRTVGLPNLGALGVCFGQVVTAMSPSSGDINYAMVVWHELAHVFAIQISNSRVPRWYTEGLSEYETVLARPEWRRENDADIYAAMQEGSLPSVAELNESFMNPSMKQVMVAYHLSSLTIEYIARTYGFDKIVEGLQLFGKGAETPEVIEKITGVKVAGFDAAFRKYLALRLAPYQGTMHIPESGYDDLKKLEIAADAKPGDAKIAADLALGYFYDGNAQKAGKAAKKALALDPKNKIALYISAEIALRGRDADGAKKHYEDLIRAGGDSFDVRSRLGMIAARAGKNDAAEKHYCAAKRLDPERSYPYQALFELFKQAGDKKRALRELESYVMIEQMQYGPVKQLIGEYAELGEWRKVAAYGELAVEINPFDVEMLQRIGEANVEIGDGKRALYHYDSALLANPPLRRPALAHIGRARALAVMGKKAEARKALAEALATEPENARALELKKTLK